MDLQDYELSGQARADNDAEERAEREYEKQGRKPNGDYKRSDYQQFYNDMLDADLDPYHYRGRFYYEGPAVNVDDLQDALSATKVKCQWDSMGLRYVVYPKDS